MEPFSDKAVDPETEIDQSLIEMKFAVASVMFLVLSAVMLAIRGAANWSQSFTVTWYGVFGSAVILAVAAVAVARGSRRLSDRRQAMIVLVALPALVAVPVLIVEILRHSPVAD